MRLSQSDGISETQSSQKAGFVFSFTRPASPSETSKAPPDESQQQGPHPSATSSLLPPFVQAVH